MKQRVLFVDDEPHVLDGLRRALRSHAAWEMVFAGSADEALAELSRQNFDAVVTDVRMPGKTGFQLLEAIRAGETTQNLPVIILTGEHDLELKRRALDMGASDLLNKPVCPADLAARLGSVLRLKSYQDQITAQNALLEDRVRERTAELAASRQEIVWRLAKAGEYRDEQTGNHVLRVAQYCRVIGNALGLNREFVEMLTLTSPLHDIGKIGIPDSILHKPGKLTPDEWEIMKQHSAIGARILREAYAVPFPAGLPSHIRLQDSAACRNCMLDMAAVIALNHHERWDGSGYPHNIAGEAIPLEARIVALADVYDALGSARPYKRAFAEGEVMAHLADGVGAHFDPYAYSGLLQSRDALRAIRAEYPDCQSQPESATQKAA